MSHDLIPNYTHIDILFHWNNRIYLLQHRANLLPWPIYAVSRYWEVDPLQFWEWFHLSSISSPRMKYETIFQRSFFPQNLLQPPKSLDTVNLRTITGFCFLSSLLDTTLYPGSCVVFLFQAWNVWPGYISKPELFKSLHLITTPHR